MWWLESYTAATTMENTMVTVHRSDMTCSVQFFLQKKKKEETK